MHESGQQPAARGEKPFRLVKFFALASFIVLVIFSFPFSVLVSQQAKDLLMASYEKYALLMGENLSHQVYRYFVRPLFQQRRPIMLRDEEQAELMDRIVRNTIHGFKIDMVNIYDIRKGVIAYSTSPRMLGKEIQINPGYEKAVQGEPSSGMMAQPEDILGVEIERPGEEMKLRTYVPFITTDPYSRKQMVSGVFEIIQDLTDEYGSILRLQYFIFGLSSLIMGLIFVALLLIVRKAENTLAQRARAQRQLEAQLHQAERLAALGRMCAGVSHEIRNPLGIIRSTAELLSSMPKDQEAHRRLADVIIEEASRLNNVVTEFLDFARPREPMFQHCDLADILRRNLAFLEPELQKEGIRLEHDLDHGALILQADPNLLYRAFLNLLANAVQAMPGGGLLRVSAHADDGFYRVQIQDTGPGIESQHLERIFEPFFSTKDKGSGLGLAIVRNIVEAHRGTIRVQSVQGQGTRITLTFPRILEGTD